jgi:hypothetical protein
VKVKDGGKIGQVKNEWVDRCETEQFLSKSFTNFTWDVCPGASGPYVFFLKCSSFT